MAINDILCPFCSAPWSEENITLVDADISDECEDGRFGPPTCTIIITCHSCKRNLFRKENTEIGC
jgi:hypothetical protein